MIMTLQLVVIFNFQSTWTFILIRSRYDVPNQTRYYLSSMFMYWEYLCIHCPIQLNLFLHLMNVMGQSILLWHRIIATFIMIKNSCCRIPTRFWCTIWTCLRRTTAKLHPCQRSQSSHIRIAGAWKNSWTSSIPCVSVQIETHSQKWLKSVNM